MGGPLVQILLDDTTLTPSVRGALRRIGAEVEVARFTGDSPEPTNRPLDARLVLTADARSTTRGKLDKLHEWFDADPCATLVLGDGPVDPPPRSDHAAGGRAIGFGGGLSQDDLVSRLSAMCDLRRPMEALRSELEVLRQRDRAFRAALHHLDTELRLAGAVQRDLLPSTMPPVNGADIHTLYRPVHAVSGDIYEVVRLDGEHIAISLADATGHGVAAALLTAFAKRGLRGSETVGGRTHRLEPNEVLARLNRDILEMQLQECQFVTAVHAVYNERTHVVRWSRGGAPYPILARRGQPPYRHRSDGPIIGAYPQAPFEVTELQLGPGDVLVFHTDGLEALLLDRRSGSGPADLDCSPWFRALGRQPIEQLLSALETRLDELDPADWEADDLSAVILQVQDSRPRKRTARDVCLKPPSARSQSNVTRPVAAAPTSPQLPAV
jgi:serine phosphatase RsbU (regulator of sigma subunit)